MKPMTEQEARAALKAEMPWGRVSKPFRSGRLWCLFVRSTPGWSTLLVRASGLTLRAAVAKAIRAWRATQKYTYTVPYSMKKGAKR